MTAESKPRRFLRLPDVEPPPGTRVHDFGYLYVMYSRARDLSKVGFSTAPGPRVCRVRKDHVDYTIQLVAFWNIFNPGEGSRVDVEQLLHAWLTPLSARHPTRIRNREWYQIYWPNLVSHIESLATVLAAMGILIRRGRLVREN